MVKGSHPPFHGLEKEIMEYLCEAKRTPGQVIDHLLLTEQPNMLSTLNRLVREGWIVPVRQMFWSGQIPEWTWRNMDPKPSYVWRWDGWMIVGCHRLDRQYIGPIWDMQSFVGELDKIRDAKTYVGPSVIQYTLGDEMAVIARYEERFGKVDFDLAYQAMPVPRKGPGRSRAQASIKALNIPSE